MRIAVVSDIHGNLPALEAVVRDIERRGVDAVVNLGDCVSGPLLPRETAQFLMARDWTHLAGNHERQLLTGAPGRRCASDAFALSQLTWMELEWLASLRPCVRFVPGVLLCHGTPSDDGEYLLETVEPTRVRAATAPEIGQRLGAVEAELILCGHSHVPRAVRASAGGLIVNPGSVGLQAYDDTRPYPHVIETGSPDARYAVVERSDGDWVPTFVSVPYAHVSMATLARSRQREDWEVALRSGRMS
jgi:predicted phosphodiesterase